MSPFEAELLFWPGSLAARGLDAVIDAAAAGGFRAAAVSPLLLHDGAGTNPSPAARARARGVRLAVLDGVSSWAPIRYGPKVPESMRARLDFAPERTLDLAAEAGMDVVLAAGAFEAGTIAVAQLIAAFGEFCDAAAERALRVELEFVPFWGIPDLATAWQIVDGADRTNGSLLIDSWHLYKGIDSPEASFELLAGIPASKLTGLQLADGSRERKAKTLFGEGIFRQFPGDGELPLGRLIAALAANGAISHVGAEIFGSAIDDLESTTAGRRAAESVAQTLDAPDAHLDM
jgi:sugar phosphate isomerase/epimerase